jgi:histidine phosphotransfer protein HptB
MSLSKEDLLDFNIIQSLKELGGEDGNDFFKEIIDLYKEQYQLLLQKIKDCQSNNDFENLSKSAHSLNGASLNVGAKEMASICKKIEINAKSEIKEGLIELISNLELVQALTFVELDKL